MKQNNKNKITVITKKILIQKIFKENKNIEFVLIFLSLLIIIINYYNYLYNFYIKDGSLMQNQ